MMTKSLATSSLMALGTIERPAQYPLMLGLSIKSCMEGMYQEDLLRESIEYRSIITRNEA